jgi:hypothetical protein
MMRPVRTVLAAAGIAGLIGHDIERRDRRIRNNTLEIKAHGL